MFEVTSIDDLPDSAILKHFFTSKGWVYGSRSDQGSQHLRQLPHNFTISDFCRYQGPLSDVVDCAQLVISVFDNSKNDNDLIDARHLTEFEDGVCVGPLQLSLFEALSNLRYRPKLISGYRSPQYQAILFALRYLEGTLFDPLGRYFVSPPCVSQHSKIDGALDIEDSDLFAINLARLGAGSLPFSLTQPFLFHHKITHEPWHWQCQGNHNKRSDNYINEKEQLADKLSDIAEFFGGMIEKSSYCGNYVFVAEVSLTGHGRCIGSCQDTIAESISDAMDHLSTESYAYQITVPSGYTPIMDNRIQATDLGSSTFKLSSSSGGSTSFVTGSSCCHSRVLCEKSIISTLKQKASLSDDDDYLLERSNETSVLWFTNRTATISKFGLPYPYAERRSETCELLANSYVNWLSRSSQGHLPPYFSNDLGRTVSWRFDETRYAFLFYFMSKWSTHFHGSCSHIVANLKNLFFEGTRWQRTIDGNRPEDGAFGALTSVFLIGSLLETSQWEVAQNAWEAQREMIRDLVDSYVQIPETPNVIFLGHLAEILTSAHHRCVPIELPALSEVLASNFKPSLFCSPSSSLAVSQLIEYGALVAECDIAPGFASNYLEEIVSLVGSPARHEQGSFEGAENFMTALVVEAMPRLIRAANCSDEDVSIVYQRGIDAMQFIRTLQFLPGSGVFTPNPHMLEGAIRYSCIDHHYRFDYGIHATIAAWEMLSLSKRS